MVETKFTRFEKVRIIGARALQLAMGAPLLIRRPKDEFSTVRLAEIELAKNVLPITVKRPAPVKLELLNAE